MKNKIISTKSAIELFAKELSVDLIDYVNGKIVEDVFFKEVGITANSIINFLTRGDLYLHPLTSTEVFNVIDESSSLERQYTNKYAMFLRSFINELPVSLRIKICYKILTKNPHIKEVMDEYLDRFYGVAGYEIIDVMDMSSSRYHKPNNLCLKIEIEVDGQSKYIFIKNGVSPQAKMFSMLREALDCSVNRELYSKDVLVSDFFTSEIVTSKMFLVKESVITLRDEFDSFRYPLLKALAKEAAVSDLVYRGDRSFIDVRGGDFFCNYFVDLQRLEQGEGLYAIDFEYFNKDGFYIMENARRHIIEMAAILFMPNLNEEMPEYLRVFKDAYLAQVTLIRNNLDTIHDLIGIDGDDSVSLNMELLDNPDEYLNEIWKQIRGS